MAKRSGYFQLKQPFASKKPKLDIEITPSQAYNAQPSTSKTSSVVSNGVTKSATSSSAAAEIQWDDDDDDIIVLASQAIEADLTFGKFGGSIKTSTQQTTTEVVTTGRQHIVGGTNGKLPGKLPDKLLAELFADGEDDLFSEKLDDNYSNIDNAISAYFNNNDDFNLDVFRNEQQIPPPHSGSGKQEPSPKPALSTIKETSPWEEDFKVPEAPPPALPKASEPSKPYVKNEQPSTSRLGIFRPKTSTATSFKASSTPSYTPKAPPKEESEEKPLPSSQKQEHAKDIQVKFLTKHVEQLAKKVDSLQKDYNEAVEKAQIKDGEVSMLRYELKTVKSTNEQLRLEKMREKETIQKEWIEKMKQLEKTISAQKVENEFKEMEIMNLKSKRLNATMRSVEPPASTVPAPSTSKAEPKVTEESFVLTTLLPKLSLRQPVELVEESHFDPEAFVTPTDGAAPMGKAVRKYSKMSRSELTIADQLVSLQICLSKALATSDGGGGGKTAKIVLSPSLLPLVTIATEKGLDEIEQYCQRLQQHKETEFRLSGRRSKMEHNGPVNLFQQEKLFVGEEAVVIRRFLALVGLYCRISNELAMERLLEMGLVLRLSKNMKRISTAVNVLSLHGMVTGAAALLNGLSFHPRRLTAYGAHTSQLMELFRSIVLCQTDAPSSLVQLSDFLHRLSHITDESVRQLLNRLCTSHQPIETVKQHQAQLRRHHRLKSISFSLGSCTLQMYSALLENSVRQNERYEGWQLKPLLVVTENTIHFLRNVLVEPAGWVKSFYVREDPNGCQLCHIRTVSAFVTLLHRVLLCWNQQTVREEEEKLKIQHIAQQGVLLLYDLFETSYRKKLLQMAGHTIRYRLRVTYNWLKLYVEEFNFQDTHRTTLNMMDMDLLMIDPFRDLQETEDSDEEEGRKVAERKQKCKNESKTLVNELFDGFSKTLFSNSALLE